MNTRTDTNTSRLAAAGIAGALALSACGAGDDGSGSTDLADSFESAAVCNGEPSSVNPPASEPFAGYSYLTTGDGWTTGWFGVFGDQRAIVGDDATAILCITVADTTEVERCEYEEDGESFTLVLVDADYEIELRNADTANVIARDSFSVAADDCPFITSWTEGEAERTSYPVPGEEQIDVSIGPFLG